MSIDIVIVTFNSFAEIGDAIRSCRSCNDIASIIVVDNASSDGSASAAASAGADRVLQQLTNEGFARAVNRGVSQGSAEFVLLLNPDARVTCEVLCTLRSSLEAAPRAVMVAPQLLGPDGTLLLGARKFSTACNRVLWWLPMPRWARRAWATPEYLDGERMVTRAGPIRVDYLWGAALLVRRSFLEEIGGLDERFFIYSEDEDLGRAARARGLDSLLVPQVRVAHSGGASTGDQAWARARMQAANRLLLAKWDGEAAAAGFWFAVNPILLVRAAVLRLMWRRDEATEAARMRSYLSAARIEMDSVWAERFSTRRRPAP